MPKIQKKSTQSSKTKQKTVGIIGYGRFGQLATRELIKDFPLRVYDTKNMKTMQWTPLHEVCQADYLILCVPISKLENVLTSIKSLVKPPTIVIDVCSVKEYPVRLMKRILPKNIPLLATHPLFGPDSAAISIRGRKIVLCKVRLDKKTYHRIQQYLTKKGLVCVHLSPQAHDRLIAESQVLTHVIGRALQMINAKKTPIDTEAYERLLHMCEVVQYDTVELFKDMNHYNRFTPKTRAKLRKALQQIERWLSNEHRIPRN
ncbi:prephenate dehydrogenase/arogenate dehydrogenase family protein [Candidatus Woesearchaeota archaeon]|nr:prephenate dehydrogenase/arogenate dehydrogenase family protein [Candidatus Woesearchaeota archaeon]